MTNDVAVSFDPCTHTYRDHNGVVPSVTQILRLAGVIDTRWFDDASATRGTHVATATEYHDQGELDVDSLDSMYRPYVDAWAKFLKQSGFEVIHIEEQVYEPILRYAGRVDRVGLLNGRPCVLDIKTGAHAAWHDLQLAAYSHALNDNNAMCRVVVYLTGLGTFTVHTCTDYQDYIWWRAACQLASFHLRHGAKIQ